MNDSPLVPQNLDELRTMVADCECVLAMGRGTKAPLCRVEGATRVSLRSLSGMIEYEPSEFTFTAWAGTPIEDIRAALDARHQYLPFDPMLVKAGATIGGTLAAGLSGPGRYRYGGVRDFVIGVKLLAPDGDLVQGGGKVVKNAAGFDLPKFLVGSLGRYGLMVEVSFKVFPRPQHFVTLRMRAESHQQAMQAIARIARSRWEPDAIDYRPDDFSVYLRLSGPEQAVAEIIDQIKSDWDGWDAMDAPESDAFWQAITELCWAEFDKPFAIKVPTTTTSFLELQRGLENRDGLSIHLSAAGGVTWMLLDGDANLQWLDQQLRAIGLSGLVVLGEPLSDDPGWSPRIGNWPVSQMQQSVKLAMDPLGKFPGV